jgi:hypothetical protein
VPIQVEKIVIPPSYFIESPVNPNPRSYGKEAAKETDTNYEGTNPRHPSGN